MNLSDKIKEAKEEFIKEFSNFWYPNVKGGINGVGIGITKDDSELGISVMFAGTNKQLLNKIPDTYRGFKVHKKVVGVIKPL